MGRRPKQTFFQRRHTDGQDAHEKMLNTTNYQRNANKNWSHQSEGPSLKSLQTVNAGEGVEKRKPSYTVGGNANWYSHYGVEYGSSLKN